MTLPTTGPISFRDINIELKRSPDAYISFDDPEARKLAGKPSGPISLDDFRGKSATGISLLELVRTGSFRKPFSGYYHTLKIKHSGGTGISVSLVYASGNSKFAYWDGFVNGIKLISDVDGIATYHTAHKNGATWRFRLNGTSLYIDVYASGY